MFRSDVFDYNDAYIVVKGARTVERDNDDKTRIKKLIFKNNAPFGSYISKINNTFVDNAENVDIVMPIYNLLDYSDNYYRNEINDDENENDNANKKINNNKTITIKSFECMTKIIGRTPADNNTLNVEFVVPLKYLSNFWRFLDLLLMNCETELDLS